jgi:hypothetical protein
MVEAKYMPYFIAGDEAGNRGGKQGKGREKAVRGGAAATRGEGAAMRGPGFHRLGNCHVIKEKLPNLRFFL